jgi:small subunit ribosomal protein S17
MTKTRRVEIPRQVRHPRFGKIIKKRTVCYVHDEKNESHLGDTVEIVETRPMSKTKHFLLVRVVKRAPGRAIDTVDTPATTPSLTPTNAKA